MSNNERLTRVHYKYDPRSTIELVRLMDNSVAGTCCVATGLPMLVACSLFW